MYMCDTRKKKVCSSLRPRYLWLLNDLGSDSNFDACVITITGTEMLGDFVKPNEGVETERR